ncbi:SDR family NAD(P)-dependent oxidoreductase [Xanthobacter sp. V7C-4]|uniref:SDR family NAD(P)-dependent oxidoreductase n=1 Tax=Xanthobacter autotrophicus (strain ATCC BAA-1158 / Py2) TaxID=78245 RepID=UPI00372670E2
MSGPGTGTLAGRCALITGGASGLGLAVAQAFRIEGAALVLLDLDPAAEARAQELGNAIAVKGSVTRKADIVRAFDAAEARFGPVDICVANAGVSQNAPTLSVTEEEWQRVIDINLTGTFLTAQEAGRRMIAQGGGSLLLMASMYGVVAAPERIGYCASKAAVAMMAKALSCEWARDKVRVNAIAPGYVRTALLDDLAARGRLDLDRLKARTPMGRLVEADEVARMAVFLASDASSAVTGQVMGVDGGWSAYGYV